MAHSPLGAFRTRHTHGLKEFDAGLKANRRVSFLSFACSGSAGYSSKGKVEDPDSLKGKLLKREGMSTSLSGDLPAHLADLVDLYRYRSEYSSAVGCTFPACLLLAASLEAALAAELIKEGIQVNGDWSLSDILEKAQAEGLLPQEPLPGETEVLSNQIPRLSVVLQEPGWPARKFLETEMPCLSENSLQNLRNFVNSAFAHLVARITERKGGSTGVAEDRLGAVLVGYLEELCRSEQRFAQ